MSILRTACVDYNVINPTIWLLWAEAAAENGNIGDALTRKSAVWIYKKAIERQDKGVKSWRRMAGFFEQYYSQIQYRDITETIETLRTYCIKGGDKNAWLTWARLKELIGEIGDYSTEETAAWIYKEYCLTQNRKSAYGILKWAKFANKHPMYDGETLVDACYLLRYGEREFEKFSGSTPVLMEMPIRTEKGHPV